MLTRSNPQLPAPEFPAWRIEWDRRLHRQFKRMEALEAAGKPIRKRLQYFAWYWSQRCFRSDPQRRVETSLATLLRQYRRWKAAGRVASALVPQWRPAGPAIPLAPMQRFAALLARQPWPTFQVAFQDFERRRGRVGGVGRPPAGPVPISLGQAYYAFRGGWFAGLQSRLRAVEQAQADLAEYELQLDATLRARLPHKPQRKRRTAADHSRDASNL